MRLTSLLAWIGRQATALVALIGRAAQFIWSILTAIADLRTWVPLTAVQVRRIGVDSIPVALFIALFTGIVLSLQSSYTFSGIVPLYFVGVLVGKSIMLELGPVLIGLVLAGRVGANIAAEIGTMRVTEQVRPGRGYRSRMVDGDRPPGSLDTGIRARPADVLPTLRSVVSVDQGREFRCNRHDGWRVARLPYAWGCRRSRSRGYQRCRDLVHVDSRV